MKTKIIYLLLAFMSLTCVLSAQTKDSINIELKGETLPTALKKLEQVSGYRILFTYSDVQSYRVTASIHENTITQAIEKILGNKPLTYVRKGDEYIIILPKSAQKTPVAIRGMVVDENQQPMPYCNVLLLTSDSVFVNGCVTKEDGTFLMTGEAEVPYLLKVSYIGYTTASQTVEPTNLIQLLPDTQTLKEVTVTAHRPLIESQANGLKANVAGTSLAQMGTANEMLKHLPFVTTKDGSLSVLGSGSPEIYINNRKVHDMGELDRLRATEILSAEVITTPGPEYAADVPAVIRIRTLKQRGQGWSGNVNLAYDQGHWANANQQVSLNYRTGGLDIFVKGYVSEDNSYGQTNAVIQTSGKNQWETIANDIQTSRSKRLSAETGFNYEVNEHHSFGMRYTPESTLGRGRQESWGETTAFCNGTEIDHSDFEQFSQFKNGLNHAVNAYYVGELGRWTVDFNADYLKNQSDNRQYAKDGSQEDIHSNSDSRSKLYAAKLQVGVSLGKGQLSFGTEGTLTERKALFTQSGFSEDADNLIRQKTFALFAGYSISSGKWKANAGFRYEHRETDYYDQGIRMDEQSPVYDELVPTVSVNWLHRNFNLALTYRMMKNNPSYNWLTNAISYRTQYSYTTGNPRLEPSQTNILSLNTSYKWLFASIQYIRPKNSLANITMPYNEETHPGVLLFSAANLPAYNAFSFNLTASPQMGMWQPQFSVSASLSAPDGRNLGINVYRNQPLFDFGWDNSFNLPHGWFLNLQANLHTAARMGFVVLRVEGRVNARVSKSFLKEDALTLSLTANDILRTGYYHFNVYGIDSYNGNRIYRDWQRVGIQLSYKFNATKSKYKGTGAGQSEKSRL